MSTVIGSTSRQCLDVDPITPLLDERFRWSAFPVRSPAWKCADPWMN